MIKIRFANQIYIGIGHCYSLKRPYGILEQGEVGHLESKEREIQVRQGVFGVKKRP